MNWWTPNVRQETRDRPGKLEAARPPLDRNLVAMLCGNFCLIVLALAGFGGANSGEKNASAAD